MNTKRQEGNKKEENFKRTDNSWFYSFLLNPFITVAKKKKKKERKLSTLFFLVFSMYQWWPKGLIIL